MFEQTIIMGYLAKDPEMRYTPNGVPVTNFSICIDRSFTKDDGTKVENSQWYQVSVFGKTAENAAKYLVKGSIVTIVGEVSANGYIGRDGQPAANLKLRAQKVIFGGSRGKVDDLPVTDQIRTEAVITSDVDIPF